MSNYGKETQQECRQIRRTYWRSKLIEAAIFCAVFCACVLFVSSLTGCSVTVNVASDTQPGVIIYQGETAGRME